MLKTSDGFKAFNRHGEELYGTEEMELTHHHSSFTTDLVCLNDDTNNMFTPLPNLEHDLGIDNNNIDNPISLSNTLFLEEEQLSIPAHNDVTDLNLDTSKQPSPTITQSEDMTITSIAEDQTDTLIT